MCEAMPPLLVSCVDSLPHVRHNPLVPPRFDISSAWDRLAVLFGGSGEVLLLVCMLRFVNWIGYSSVVSGVCRDEGLAGSCL